MMQEVKERTKGCYFLVEYTAAVLNKELGACITKQLAVLIGENSKFLTCIFINVSVNLKQNEVLAFWNKQRLNSLCFISK